MNLGEGGDMLVTMACGASSTDAADPTGRPDANNKGTDMHRQETELEEITAIETGRAILFLVPLAVTAWVDREPVLEELMAIAGNHSEERCGQQLGCLSDEARQFFYYQFVYRKPSADRVARVAGARWALLSMEARRQGEELARRTRHVELSVDDSFQVAFAEAMIFPEM